jgi:uncharacterized heparinase superfamily protein
VTLSQYYHTARFLRPAQIAALLKFRLQKPEVVSLPTPPTRTPRRRWVPPIALREPLVRGDRFRFLNEEREIRTATGWNDPSVEKLWLYNLHYFDCLRTPVNEGARPEALALVRRWIAENPPAKGVGWEPYPLSLRIVNWIKWGLGGEPLPDDVRASLAAQAQYLERRIEWHLLANHLFANAKALVFAGLYFEGTDADRWLRQGLEILIREANEQILPDGGHFERSTMYQCIILEDMLDLLNITGVFNGAMGRQLEQARAVWREAVPRVLQWLEAMCHPDGRIAFFNDAAFGIGPEPAELRGYARRLGIDESGPQRQGLVLLADSGYVSMRKRGPSVIFDAAPVGPDYMPGHAHADTLSFELSWNAQRVICNSGTSCYGVSARRLWERSTAAHNTLTIDGENSSEVWSGFRVARRARPFGLEVESRDGVIMARCAHDGYRRLRGKPTHRRTLWVSDSEVIWVDELEGRLRHVVDWYVPLHPNVRVAQTEKGSWRLELPSGEALLLSCDPTIKADIEQGWFSPEFGKSMARPVLRWRIEADLPVRMRCCLREFPG